MRKLDIFKLLDSDFVPAHIYTYPPRHSYKYKKVYSDINQLWKEHMVSQEIGIYIHVPFWEKKCIYCNLYAFEYRQNIDIIESYIQAICKQLEMHTEILQKYQIKTLSFGGGDPLHVGDRLFIDVFKVLDAIKPKWREDIKEISIETTPASVNEAEKSGVLFRIIQCGINRINIGAPPLHYVGDALIEHIYPEDWTFFALEILNMYKIDNISIDVMTGLETETEEKWKYKIDNILKYSPNTISFLPLTIRNDSKYGKDKNIGLYTANSYYRLYDLARNQILKEGYQQRNTIRFTRQNGGYIQEDQHYNMGTILGVGVGSRSYNMIRDYAIIPDEGGIEGVWGYINSINQGRLDEYLQYSFLYNDEERLRKKLILSYSGITVSEICSLENSKIAQSIISILEKLEDFGYLTRDDNVFYYTEKGMKYHDIIVLSFYSEEALQADSVLWKLIKNEMIF